MNVPSQLEPGATTPQQQGSPANRSSGRSRLRLATVGGIAAIAILGGGIAAAASAGTPAGAAAVGGQAVAAATGTAAPGAPGTSGPDTAAATPPAPKVHPPHLDGTVTSVSGSTVLIKDHEGFTRTIVTSSTTTYTGDLTASLAVGTRIHAEGTVASNGTSLDATVIGADKGPAAGGPGGRGPGGPRNHAGPPPAPNGAAAPNGAPAPGDAPAPGGAPAPDGTAPSTSGTAAPSTSAPATTK